MAQACHCQSSIDSSHQSVHVLRYLCASRRCHLVSARCLCVSAPPGFPWLRRSPFSTLDSPTVSHASQKQSPYCMSECHETQAPQKLSLSLLHMCQERHVGPPSCRFSMCKMVLKCYFCSKFSEGKKGAGTGVEEGMSIKVPFAGAGAMQVT